MPGRAFRLRVPCLQDSWDLLTDPALGHRVKILGGLEDEREETICGLA